MTSDQRLSVNSIWDNFGQCCYFLVAFEIAVFASLLEFIPVKERMEVEMLKREQIRAPYFPRFLRGKRGHMHKKIDCRLAVVPCCTTLLVFSDQRRQAVPCWQAESTVK